MKNVEDFDEFLKFAYETGGVRKLEEAFEEFPPEEEWHEGKIENVLNENNYKYYIESIINRR